jgi:hypothetical protein
MREWGRVRAPLGGGGGGGLRPRRSQPCPRAERLVSAQPNGWMQPNGWNQPFSAQPNRLFAQDIQICVSGSGRPPLDQKHQHTG